MPIDSRIAMGFQNPQFTNPMEMYGNVLKLRSMQQQNALAESQMADLERQRTENALLDEAYKGAYNPQTGEIDYTALAGRLAERGQGRAIPGLLKSRFETEGARYTLMKNRSAALVEEANLHKSQLQQLDPNDPNAPSLMAQLILSHHAPGTVTAEALRQQGITPEQSLSALENAVRTNSFPDFLARSQMGAEQWIKHNTLSLEQQRNLEGQQEARAETRRAAGVRERLDERKFRLEEQKERRLEKSSDSLPPAEAARERAIGESRAKFEIAFPQAKADAEQAIALIDQMIGSKPYIDKATNVRVQDKKPHPGFSEAVGAGFGTRMLPGTDAASFEALYNQVQGGAFLQAYETLRGGGAITQTEGEKATAARNRMSLAQSESDFISAAREYQEVLRQGIKRAEARAASGSPAVGGKTITRTGTLNGRKVIEYSDGSVEYAP